MKSCNSSLIVKLLCILCFCFTVFAIALCLFADTPQADAAVTSKSRDEISLLQGKDNIHYISVPININDTLWDIACKYHSGSGSIKDYIRQIKHCNNMTSDYIYAGSHIVIPIYGSNEDV